MKSLQNKTIKELEEIVKKAKALATKKRKEQEGVVLLKAGRLLKQIKKEIIASDLSNDIKKKIEDVFRD